MERSPVLWLLAAMLCGLAGCGATGHRSTPGPPLAAAAEADGGNPVRRTSARENHALPAEEPGRSASHAGDAEGAEQLAAHDPETLRLIEEELRDASPHERREMYENLKDVQAPMVRELLRLRRMVQQMGQQALGWSRAGPEPAPAPVAVEDPAKVVTEDVEPPGRYFVFDPENSVDPAGLGTVDPWTGPHGTVADSEPRPAWSYGRQPFEPADRYADARFGASDPWTRDAPAATEPGAGRVSSNGMAYGHSMFYGPNAPRADAGLPGGTLPGAGLPGAAAEPAPAGHGPGRPDADQHSSPEGSSGSSVPATAAQSETAPVHVSRGADPGDPLAASLAATAPHERYDRHDPVRLDWPEDGLAAETSPLPADDGQELPRLIALAEAEAARARLGPQPSEAEVTRYIEKHVSLRMLYLMAGQEERALTPIPGIGAADQEFWQQTFWALANYFDVEQIPDGRDRASQTVAQLRTAVHRLQENAQLEIRNVAFCHKIASFGNYERFERDEFSPGEPVLLYAEVTNFKSEPAADGQYRTLLKSSVELYSAGPNGSLVKEMQFPATEDLCRSRRRDYFHSYEFSIPQRIPPGPHVLKLTVEDQLSRKVASYSVNFTVK